MIIRRTLSLLFCLLLAPGAFADTVENVPDPLKPWVNWVKERFNEESCGVVNGQPQCIWPSHLSLSVGKDGGDFAMLVTTESDRSVSLPGDASAWPLSVRIGDEKVNQLIPVASFEGRPVVYLPRGAFRISGRFSWDEAPEVLQTPRDSGSVTLKVNGKEVIGFTVNDDGGISLREVLSAGDAVDSRRVSISVVRRIDDGIPLWVRTRLIVHVSDKRAQLRMGDPSPRGARLVNIETKLPHYQSSTGEIVIGLQGGTHTIEFTSAASTPLGTLEFDARSPQWPLEETWVWNENRQIRNASILGGTPVDPSLAGVPTEWTSLPALQVRSGQVIKIEERGRPATDRKEGAITLQRTFVRDIDQGGYTVADEIVGTLGGSGRLTLRAPAQLGYAELNGDPQLITLTPITKDPGLEVRSETIKIKATSRYTSNEPLIPAVGWDRDVDWLKVAFHIPPGEEILWIGGGDTVAGTRFSAWSLSTIFVLLLVTIVTARVMGLLPAAAAAVCFALMHGDQTSLLELFFLGVLISAIFRHQSDQRSLMIGYAVIVAIFAVQTYAYLSHDLTIRLYPELEALPRVDVPASVASHGHGLGGSKGGRITYNDARITNSVNATLLYVEGSFGALIMAGAGLMFIILATMRRFKPALICLSIAVGAFLLRSAMSTFFNDTNISDGGSFYESQYAGFNNIAEKRGLTRMADPSRDTVNDNIEPTAPARPADQKQHLTIQSGPGMPQWNGREAIVAWNGAVPKDHALTVWFLPRWAGFILVFVKLALLGYLLRVLWRIVPAEIRRLPADLRAAAVMIGFLSMLPVGTAAAQDRFPPESLLNELADRIKQSRNTDQPCKDHCVTTEWVNLSARADQLVLNATVHSVGRHAWALPSASPAVVFNSIRVNGKPAEAARREGGLVWILLSQGVHSIQASAALREEQLLSIGFQQPTGSLEIDADGFQSFVDRSSSAPTIQLLRQQRRTEHSAVTPSAALAPWFTVTRQIDLTHEGRTTTIVRRIGVSDREDLLPIDLLPGERILAGGTKQEVGRTVVGLKRSADAEKLEGLIDIESGRIPLTAKSDATYTEVWQLRCAAQWLCRFEGLQPDEAFDEGSAQYTFHPRPGDQATVVVERAQGAPGAVQSVVSANLSLEPSTHFLKATAVLVVRAGQNGSQAIGVPAGSTIREFQIDGQDSMYLMNPQARPVELPIRRGIHSYRITWQQPEELTWMPKIPRLDLGVPYTNGSVAFSVPKGWLAVHASSGPFGPRAALWIRLAAGAIAFLLVSLILPLPLNRLAALGLFAGSWLISEELGWITGFWLFTTSFVARGEQFAHGSFARLYHHRAGWAFRMILVAFPPIVIAIGLRSAFAAGPDFDFVGVGVKSNLLRWYIDRGVGALPNPTLLIVPDLVWQIVLLAWGTFAIFAGFVVLRRFLAATKSN